jgi:hypothetical protein
MTAIARGLLLGQQVESVMLTAAVSLWVFAAVGYVIGHIAQTTIETSVQDRITRELGEKDKPDSARPSQPAAGSAEYGTTPTAPAA